MGDSNRSLTGLLLLLGVVALYGYRLGVPDRPYFDELYEVPSARDVITLVRYDGQTHPLVGRYLIGLSMLIFGDYPAFWRLPSLAAGAGCLVVLYQLTLTLTGNPTTAFLAAAFMALDGLCMTQARIAMVNAPMLLFQLLSLWALATYLVHRHSRATAFFLSGVCLGLALSVKWIAVLTAGFIGLVLVELLVKTQARARLLGEIALYFGVVPIVVYFGTQVPIAFMPGRGLWDVWYWQVHMARYHGSIYAPHPWASRWWTWPLMLHPICFDYRRLPDGIMVIHCMGNLALFALMPMAMAWMAWRACRRWLVGRFVVLGFLCHWLPWALVKRVTYFQHYYAAMPFVCMAVAAWLQPLHRRAVGRLVVAGYVVLVAGLFIYWYALWTDWPVSMPFFDGHFWLESWRRGFDAPAVPSQ